MVALGSMEDDGLFNAISVVLTDMCDIAYGKEGFDSCYGKLPLRYNSVDGTKVPSIPNLLEATLSSFSS